MSLEWEKCWRAYCPTRDYEITQDCPDRFDVSIHEVTESSARYVMSFDTFEEAVIWCESYEKEINNEH